MLKLATAFSGIGAIEHALERLGIDYSIEFACDNGDVDILSKNIPDTIRDVKNEIANLEKIVDKTNDDDDWLVDKLTKVSELLKEFETAIKILNGEQFSRVVELSSNLLQSAGLMLQMGGQYEQKNQNKK